MGDAAFHQSSILVRQLRWAVVLEGSPFRPRVVPDSSQDMGCNMASLIQAVVEFDALLRLCAGHSSGSLMQ